MEDEEVKHTGLKRAMIVAIPIGLIVGFILFYNAQEQAESDKLAECNFYTVATPVRMSGSHKLYFYFQFEEKRYDDSERVYAGDLGPFYTQSSVLSRRYWVNVHCKDLKVHRVNWKAKVPDTLRDIPYGGWQEIPYGLWSQNDED